jgi:putative transcriptional regulator
MLDPDLPVAEPSLYLNGQLLIAMPHMSDPRFQRTVLYLCVHNKDGAMGLVLNRSFGQISFRELLSQLGITDADPAVERQVHFGGPVESGRGFVLHSAEYVRAETLVIGGGVALTSTLDILRAIAAGYGPKQSLLALGHAGWGPGQLDAEIQANGWLTAPADPGILFDSRLDSKWERALKHLGVDPYMLSDTAGHA